MEKKSKKFLNPGKGEALEAALLISLFEKTVESNIGLNAKIDTLCQSLRENTSAVNKLLNHLSSVPVIMEKIKYTVGLMKWGLFPVIVSLLGLVIFFALRD